MPAAHGAARFVDHVMGIPISLAMRGRHARTRLGRTAWADVMAELHRLDTIFSTYRKSSVISQLDRAEISPHDCPAEVAEVFKLAAVARNETSGAFDIWRQSGDGARHLDPSGVVKGWAIERASSPLRLLDETDFCLSGGGDMVCRVASPDAPAWRIGIEHPHDLSRLIAVVPLQNGAIATSGGAHRGEHLVDARTGLPVRGVASVTVVAASLTVADIDATSAYVLGKKASHWLSSRPGRTGFVVWPDGSTTTTGDGPVTRN
jgi:thiamine biosynthesis lipoprotein